MDALESKLLNVTKIIEKQVDEAIEKIENLDVNDIEKLRKNRLNELKELQAKKSEWLSQGHGKYEELPEEKQFFDIIKKSKNAIVHFYTNSSQRSPIVDMHLKILAPKHLETKFVKMNAEKCPFLAENLKIKTIPTIVLVQNGIMVDKIVGFTQLGNCDDFSTEILEWRIAQNGTIDYEGDLSTPPGIPIKQKSSGKKIRDGAFNQDDSDDLDVEECGLARDSMKQSNLKSVELTEEEAAELGI